MAVEIEIIPKQGKDDDECCIVLYAKVAEILKPIYGDKLVNQETHNEFIRLLSKVEKFYRDLPENPGPD